MLIIDFETRSRVDLNKHGAYIYAADPSTEILCMAWRDGISNTSGVWYPGDKIPRKLLKAFKSEQPIAAWNANFDRLIYENCEHPFPELPLSRWRCLSAQARLNALPAGLDACHRAIFSGAYGKAVTGRQLIDALCKPDADGNFYEDAQLLEELGAYAHQDVLASYKCWREMRGATPREVRDYHVNERINDNGVRIDTELCEAAVDYADEERKELGLELSALTGGRITAPTQTQRIRDFVYTHSSQEVQNMMTVYKKGEAKRSLDKRIRENILAAADEHAIELPDTVYDVICCAHEGSNTSVAKFKRMLERADAYTDRACGAFLHAGASQTHRYASRGVQLHNFRRDTFDEELTAEYRADMLAGRSLPCVMDTLSRMLRSAIVPEEGAKLVVADWEQIEARVLPWLSYSVMAHDRLDIFRRGDDIYQITADQIGALDRQVGKVADLSLGFGGGSGAFTAMARNYDLNLPGHVVDRTVAGWRTANPWATEFWQALRRASINAMRDPGRRFYAGRVYYRFNPHLLGGTLICTLPCGTEIQYPQARLEQDLDRDSLFVSAMKANWTPAAGDKEWPRVRLWHGLLAENVTQATAASLLRYALTELHMDDWDIVAHVHDEIVLEVPTEEIDAAMDAVTAVMVTTPPTWAVGLPLGVDIKVMSRYGK